ncbi:MAG TPA: 50S ribosomal protein L4 [Armatimonadota bacterium]|nr:50S ribosomal protein L4 [Armatimonadota bacterium]HOM82996.1 50S ribosomal protein L4 [Armatimonadota bacterium]HPO72090.1 50S ribosomal protein L4 [Armatimonadota bacterium]HPT98189.1 50S ribosomal protein L4 [Armatimonadota bacterium]
MPTINIVDMEGQKVGDLALRDDFFGISPNEGVMHQAVVTYLANQRQGTHDTRPRSEVAGGARKPYRQKGTGRARQGTIRAPQYRHGGVVFGPHPRDYRKALPKKMKRLAIASAFSTRVAAGDVVVVDAIEVGEISTKRMVEFLGRLDATGKVLIILAKQDPVVWKSARNIPGVKVTVAPNVSTYDLLWADKIVMDRGGADRFPGGEE